MGNVGGGDFQDDYSRVLSRYALVTLFNIASLVSLFNG